MSISEEQVKNALKSVKYPGFTRDIVSFGLIKSIQIDNGEVKVQLALATNDPNVPATIKNDAEKALRTLDGVQRAKVLIDIHAPPAGAGTGMGATRIPGIRHVIAVASGKGGVGNRLLRQIWRWQWRKPECALACAIATFMGPAFHSCSVRANGQCPRKLRSSMLAKPLRCSRRSTCRCSGWLRT